MGRETELDHDGAEGGYGGDSHLVDEAALFASPLPMVGVERTTTRKELWVSYPANIIYVLEAFVHGTDKLVLVCLLHRELWTRYVLDLRG
jgi:hypothetical protein